MSPRDHIAVVTSFTTETLLGMGASYTQASQLAHDYARVVVPRIKARSLAQAVRDGEYRPQGDEE